MGKPTFVLIISCHGWSDSIASVHTSQAAAEKALIRYAKANWDGQFSRSLDPDEDGEALVEAYFGSNPNFESYEILAA